MILNLDMLGQEEDQVVSSIEIDPQVFSPSTSLPVETASMDPAEIDRLSPTEILSMGNLYLSSTSNPTLSGLVLSLGFVDVESFNRHRVVSKCRDQYNYLLTRLQDTIESRLYDKETAGGAKFWLLCKAGWEAKDDPGKAKRSAPEINITFNEVPVRPSPVTVSFEEVERK